MYRTLVKRKLIVVVIERQKTASALNRMAKMFKGEEEGEDGES